MSTDRNIDKGYAANGADPSSDVEQPTYFTYDTSEFAAAANSDATAAKAEPSEPFDYIKLAMEEMNADPVTPPPAPAPQPQQRASVQPVPVQPPAQAAAPSAPVNPLVAARANAASASATNAGGGLYPISDVDSTGSRSFDTSFGEKKSHKGVVIGVLLLLIALAAGGFFGYRYLMGKDAEGVLASAIERLRDSDEVIIPLDQTIATEIETGIKGDNLAFLMEQSDLTDSILADAVSIADQAQDKSQFLSSDAAAALSSVTASVEARRSMIEVGRTLLAADTKVGAALEHLNAAYASIATANERVQWGLDSYNGYWNAANNGEDVSGWDLWSIVGLESDALSYIQAAQASTAAAKEAMPEADLSVLDWYLQARAAHIDALIQIDTALANGDFDTVWALGDAVNQADATQAQAAASVPQDPGELLAASYAAMTASQRQDYENARIACVNADSVINSYLGVSAPSTQQSTAPLADTAAAPSE